MLWLLGVGFCASASFGALSSSLDKISGFEGLTS